MVRDRKNFSTNDKCQNLPDDVNQKLWTVELLKDLCAYHDLGLGGKRDQLVARLQEHERSGTFQGAFIPRQGKPGAAGTSATARAESKTRGGPSEKKAKAEDDDETDDDEPAEVQHTAKETRQKGKKPVLPVKDSEQNGKAGKVKQSKSAGGKKPAPKNGFVTSAGGKKRKRDADAASAPPARTPTPVPTKAPTKEQKGTAKKYKDEVQTIRQLIRVEQGTGVGKSIFGEVYKLLQQGIDALHEVEQADSRHASPEEEDDVADEEVVSTDEHEDALLDAEEEEDEQEEEGEAEEKDEEYEPESPPKKKARACKAPRADSDEEDE